MRDAATRLVAAIRIDAIWLAIDPMDMRGSSDTALARVVNVFGAARPHHAHLLPFPGAHSITKSKFHHG